MRFKNKSGGDSSDNKMIAVASSGEVIVIYSTTDDGLAGTTNQDSIWVIDSTASCHIIVR